jgi:hypothetical protein
MDSSDLARIFGVVEAFVSDSMDYFEGDKWLKVKGWLLGIWAMAGRSILMI